MSPRLLITKFHIPPLSFQSISRRRLLEQLDAGVNKQRKLTLVSAPAGYGKTTLVSEWVQMLHGKTRVIWISLDEADNDLHRFMNYWLTAFQSLDKSLEILFEPVLTQAQLSPVDLLLDELINALTTLNTPVVIVLDDYHVIKNGQIHAALDYFLNRQPVGVHLALTTREDPPLPLPRLRARGQMTEIRARDLRFTVEEARSFIYNSINLDLAQDILQTLEDRTEGWAVGLQLAALALQNQAHPSTFIETFSGSHRYIFDYLAEEVIRQQEEKNRHFLNRTCVLDRFNADLCNTLTGRTDSRAIIEQLERINLFIVPLDDEREWYRYHHLFGDYLRSTLDKSQSTALNREAALWHQSNEMTFEAVHYALNSADLNFAAEVIEHAIKKDSTWSGGQIATLSAWLDALPGSVLKTRPLLSLHASRIAYLSGRFEQAESMLEQVETHLTNNTEISPESNHLLALAALYRGGISAMRGETQKSLIYTRRALSGLHPEEQLARARATYSLGLAYDLSGETEPAIQAYQESSHLAQAAGVLFLAVNAACAAALALISMGKLQLAAQTCRSLIEQASGSPLAPTGLAWMILGAIAIEQDDLNLADSCLQQGMALARQGGLVDDLNTGLIFLTRLKCSRGDLLGAFAALEESTVIINKYNLSRLTHLAAAYLARLQLAAGQFKAAATWAAQYRLLRSSQNIEYLCEFEDLTLARVQLAAGETEATQAELSRLLQQASDAARNRVCIEVLILQAQAYHADGDVSIAINCLSRALNLAAPEGFKRVFLDEGPALVELLKQARTAAPDMANDLLSAFTPLEPPPSPLANLLSEQELRVLKLIVAGKSNQDIASELVISVGTAKWHVHNVLQKLGVNNRPQAMARAREFGL